jgi:plastocyanin
MGFKTYRSIALCGALLALLVARPARVHGQETWRAAVGAQSKDLGHQALAFLPNEIWIHAGDSVTWTVQTDEIHTVSFLKPNQVRLPFSVGCPGLTFTPTATFDGSTCVTTPPLVKGQTFTVQFPKVGNYKLVCLVHENMTGAVHVLDLAEPLPHDQNFYDNEARDIQHDMLADRDGDRDHPNHPHSGHVVAGIGEVSATAGGSSTLSVLRFNNSSMVIHAGQTVEWTNEDPITPHTITFGTEPLNPIPPSGTFTVDGDGALHATISSTSDSVHSGFIVAAPQDRIGLPQAALGNTRFRVTFPKVGVFPYICALHDDLGMKGTITVVP